jgi:hypothetical protein
MADYEKKEYAQNALWTKVEGVFEITNVGKLSQSSFGEGGYIFLFGAVYFINEGKKQGFSTINMTADGALADKIDGLGLKNGERIHIVGTLGQKKENRFKDANGKDIYYSTIRLKSLELVTEFETVKPDTPKAQQPPKQQYQTKKEQPKAELVILDDDLPF